MHRVLAALSAATVLTSVTALAPAEALSGHHRGGMTVVASGSSQMQAAAQALGGSGDNQTGGGSHDGNFEQELLALSSGDGASATADVVQDDTVSATDVHVGITSTGQPNGGTVSVTNKATVSFTPSQTGVWQVTLDGQNNGSTDQGCVSGLTVSFTLLDEHQVPCNGGTFLLQRNLKLVGGVTYSFAGGHDASSLDGTAFVTMEAKYLAPPVNTKVPTIAGTPAVGRTLKATKGTWQNAPTRFTYRWLRSGKAIAGATKASYKLTGQDAGKRIAVQVTASNTGGRTTATSKSTAAVVR